MPAVPNQDHNGYLDAGRVLQKTLTEMIQMGTEVTEMVGATLQGTPSSQAAVIPRSHPVADHPWAPR
eukprot:3909722-Prorocentrum_lima.AAC.1